MKKNIYIYKNPQFNYYLLIISFTLQLSITFYTRSSKYNNFVIETSILDTHIHSPSIGYSSNQTFIG